MNQSQTITSFNQFSPTLKNTNTFITKHKGTNFSSFSGANPTRSLNSSGSKYLISSSKGQEDQLTRKFTNRKFESLKGAFINPETNFELFEPMSIKSFKNRKPSDEMEPRFQFKPRNQTSKRVDTFKMDNINNALELFIEKKQLNYKKKSLHQYSKPIIDKSSPLSTKQQQSNTSQQYGTQVTSKLLQFKKGTFSERSNSNSKPRQARINSMYQPQGNKTPCLNDFILGKKLGKGKFGQVFLVKHKRIGLICAMKVIPKDTIKQNQLQNQLSREIMIQLYLNNPNIIQMYGIFTQNNNIYLLLEPCLDGHLLTQLKRKRRFDQEQTSNIMKQLLQGIDIMHRSSVIHRDIKPQNICRHQGVSKISDFGWAVYSPDSLRQTFCGTPLYMSPQLLTGQQYTQSVDIWALGMLAYELLVGRLPFKVQKSQQLSRIITDTVEFPQHVQISDIAKDFILTLLKKDPKQRVQIDDLLCHTFLNKASQ